MARRFEVHIVAGARKTLLRIPEPHRERIRLAIRRLGLDPRPAGVEPMAGHQDTRRWRIRVGTYRVIYEIHDDRLLVLVIRIGHRGQVYRVR